MVFIETLLFTKLLSGYLDDDEYQGLQKYLLKNPSSGDLVKKTGGVRKLRWKKRNKGKRGGLRIIYFWVKDKSEIWMLTLYAKSEASTIPSHLLKKIAEEISYE